MSGRKSKILKINLTLLAEEMVKAGFTEEALLNDDLGDWTNTIVDILEEKYDLETKVTEEIKRGPSK